MPMLYELISDEGGETPGGDDPDPTTGTKTYYFTSKSWEATLDGVAANWTSGKDGNGFVNNGVQVTTGVTGANATSPISFSNVSKVVVTYNTNKNKGQGSIDIKIGDNATISNKVGYSGSDDGTSALFTTEFTVPEQSGYLKLTANTTTNSSCYLQLKRIRRRNLRGQ